MNHFKNEHVDCAPIFNFAPFLFESWVLSLVTSNQFSFYWKSSTSWSQVCLIVFQLSKSLPSQLSIMIKERSCSIRGFQLVWWGNLQVTPDDTCSRFNSYSFSYHTILSFIQYDWAWMHITSLLQLSSSANLCYDLNFNKQSLFHITTFLRSVILFNLQQGGFIQHWISLTSLKNSLYFSTYNLNYLQQKLFIWKWAVKLIKSSLNECMLCEDEWCEARGKCGMSVEVEVCRMRVWCWGVEMRM